MGEGGGKNHLNNKLYIYLELATTRTGQFEGITILKIT